METGIRHTEKVEVTKLNTAHAVGSGTLEVFSTPSMIALMEQTCYNCVQPHLDEGLTTVGTLVNIEHISATPVGMTVTAECTLRKIDSRRLVFEVTASDEKGTVGKGTHERFIVRTESFVRKTYSKLD